MEEKMKPSGIVWIGDIPESWNTKRVKYVATLKGRIGWQGLTSDEYTDEGPYLITGIDFQNGCIDWSNCVHVSDKRWEEASEIQIKNGDLLITKDGTVGKVAIVSGLESKASLNSGVLLIRTGKGYDKRFLFWVLQSEEFWTWFRLKNAGNSTIIHLYQGDFAEFCYTFPHLPEQQAIADYLDAQCAKIDSVAADLEKQIDLLQKYKKSLITETVTKGLDKSVPTKNSGIEWIGEIPLDWKVSRIKYLIDPNHPYPIGDGDHGIIKADDYLDEGIPYIRVLNLTWGYGLNMDSIVYISKEMNAQIKNSELKPNDLLIAKTGATIGKTAIVPNSLPISNTTSHVGKITLPTSHDAKYFYYVLTSDIIQKQIQDISAMQSTRPELGIDGLKNMVVVVPTISEQQAISQYLDKHCAAVDEIIKAKNEQLSVINTQKMALIYEYVTGKKRVKEAEKWQSKVVN